MTVDKALKGEMAIMANHCLTIALLGRTMGWSRDKKKEMMKVVDEAFSLFEDIMLDRLAGENATPEAHAAQRAEFKEALTYLVGVAFRSAGRLAPVRNCEKFRGY